MPGRDKHSSLFVQSISNKDLTYGKISLNQIYLKQVLWEGRLLAYYCLKKPAGDKHSSLFVQNIKVQTFKVLSKASSILPCSTSQKIDMKNAWKQQTF